MIAKRTNGLCVDQALIKASREWMWKHREWMMKNNRFHCQICGSHEIRFTDDQTSIVCMACGSIMPGLDKDVAA